jgi:GT2 family glycosyltransferase
VRHIPKVLYHWRIIPGSTAAGGGEKPYAFLAAMRVVKEHLERQNIRAEVDEAVEGMSMMRVKYALPDELPLVSIIIPTRNGKQLVQQCIDSITEKTTYPNYEIILVDNGSDDADALAYFAGLDQRDNITVLRDDRPFNYSALNNEAVNVARGELVCLLNNDIEVITPDWLDEMVSHAVRPGIGAVGARLWYPNDTLQHGGVILGMGGVAGHVHVGITRHNLGYFGRGWLIQNLSAVTAACLLIRKDIYQQVEGLDEKNLTVAFNDVDFCIRVRDAGYRNLWTPYAELYHHESATRGYDLDADKVERFKREVEYMRETYGEALDYDPAFNPNLALNSSHCTLAFPPREPRV